MTVSFFPGVPRCSTCECGIARVVVDGDVWLCEGCAEVLGVLALPIRTAAPVPPADDLDLDERSGPSLEETIDALLRGACD